MGLIGGYILSRVTDNRYDQIYPVNRFLELPETPLDIIESFIGFNDYVSVAGLSFPSNTGKNYVYRFNPNAISDYDFMHQRWIRYDVGAFAPSTIVITTDFTYVSTRDSNSEDERKILVFANDNSFIYSHFTTDLPLQESVPEISFPKPYYDVDIKGMMREEQQYAFYYSVTESRKIHQTLTIVGYLLFSKDITDLSPDD
jgi:hypothetical protein